jgi:hypothetical protein
MYDDDNENYLLYRQKTCPCCRAVVSSRPIPIFIVKTIATALAKTKNLTLNRSRSNRTSPAPDDDPWAGLFPPAEDETFDDDEDQDDDEDEDDGDVEWGMNVFAYGSASDEEPYEGEYVPAQWEPPSVNTHLEDFPYDEAFQSDDLCMFRRGVTMEMIANYQIEVSIDYPPIVRLHSR